VLAGTLLVSSMPALASAAEDHPWAYSLRPMTLPAMTLAPEAGFNVNHYAFGPAELNQFSWTAGASFGILDDLSVELIPLGFYHQVMSVDFGDFSDSDTDTDYHYMLAGATYRFLDGDVDLGTRFRFAVDSWANIYLNPSFLVRLKTEVVRLDTGVEFAVVIRDQSTVYSNSDVMVGLQGFGQWLNTPRAGIPVELAFQIVDPFYLALNTGLGVGDFTADDAGDTVFMPLGWGAGGTIPYDDDQPMVDIAAGFSFPLFLIGAAEEDLPIEEFWQVGLKATGFIYL
jgi:hypothetical protein